MYTFSLTKSDTPQNYSLDYDESEGLYATLKTIF
jgi:hypothetical protein